jgi:hypothetical protein
MMAMMKYEAGVLKPSDLHNKEMYTSQESGPDIVSQGLNQHFQPLFYLRLLLYR